MKSIHQTVVAAALALFTVASAHASVLFTVTEQSNKVAVITASGTLGTTPPAYDQHIISFDDLLSGLGTYDNASVLGAGSTMQVGSTALTFADTAGPGYNMTGDHQPALYVGAMSPSWYAINFQAGSNVTGQLIVNLTGTNGVFANTGTTGTVYWGDSGYGQAIGTYQIVSASASTNVPEPASLALIGGGLLAALAARRSRRA